MANVQGNTVLADRDVCSEGLSRKDTAVAVAAVVVAAAAAVAVIGDLSYFLDGETSAAQMSFR